MICLFLEHKKESKDQIRNLLVDRLFFCALLSKQCKRLYKQDGQTWFVQIKNCANIGKIT